jgi:hypothetical protein
MYRNRQKLPCVKQTKIGLLVWKEIEKEAKQHNYAKKQKKTQHNYLKNQTKINIHVIWIV